MRRYEQAAAAYGNYVNLLPNKDRSDKAAWSRSQIRFLRSFGEREPIAIDDDAAERPAHRGFPRHRRQGDRQGARQRRPPAGLRARHRLRADDDFAPDRVERGGAPDHLHAERRRRRSRTARPAAGPPRHARDRHAQVEQRADADQGAGAARHPEARDRELLAARPRAVDDHRLRDPQADASAASCRRRRPNSGCRCAITACRWCAAC